MSNITKQKAIVKKLAKDLEQKRPNFVGFHAYGNYNCYIDDYRIMIDYSCSDLGYPHAKEPFNVGAFIEEKANYTCSAWEKYVIPKNEVIAIITDIKNNYRNYRSGERPYCVCISNGNKIYKIYLNPKFYRDALEWCKDDITVYVNTISNIAPVVVTGSEGCAITLPIRYCGE